MTVPSRASPAPSWISTFCMWQRTIFSCFTLWNVFSGIVSAPPLGRSARKRLETRSTGKHEGLHARSVVLVQFNGADLALYGPQRGKNALSGFPTALFVRKNPCREFLAAGKRGIFADFDYFCPHLSIEPT